MVAVMNKVAHLCPRVLVCMGDINNHRKSSAWVKWGPDRRGANLEWEGQGDPLRKGQFSETQGTSG